MARHASLIATTTTTNTDVFAESHFKSSQVKTTFCTHHVSQPKVSETR